MATRAVGQDRLNWAYQELLKCRPTHRVVAELSERWGISRRQARRIVSRAYTELRDDLGTIERPEMMARCILWLETAIEGSLQAGHGSAAVGGVRLLADLLQLTRPAPPPPPAQFASKRF